MSSRRILIIDDNVALAENIAEILGYEGHATDIAASADEALAKALDQAVDVVVTDHRLPGMNGVDLLLQLRDILNPLRAVVITAYMDDRMVTQAEDLGAAVMPKPINFGLLSLSVREVSA